MQHLRRADVDWIARSGGDTDQQRLAGVPPAGPALANAIYAATGKRVPRLPMTEDGITIA